MANIFVHFVRFTVLSALINVCDSSSHGNQLFLFKIISLDFRSLSVRLGRDDLVRPH